MDAKWILVLTALGLVILLLAIPVLGMMGGFHVLPRVGQAWIMSLVSLRRALPLGGFGLFFLLSYVLRLVLYGAVVVLIVLILRSAGHRPPPDRKPTHPGRDETADLRAEIDRLQARLDRLKGEANGEDRR